MTLTSFKHHPVEYIESDWTPDREDDDEEILGEIISALSWIYDQNLEWDMHLCAPNCGEKQVDLFQKVPPFDKNVTQR